MNITPYSLAERFIGVKEIPGAPSSPFVMSMLTLDQSWPQSDEVPWCSAFVNYIHWLLRMPRSKDLRARSWLTLGEPVRFDSFSRGDAYPTRGWDVVIIKRGLTVQPGPEVIDAPGHVGFFSGWAPALPGAQTSAAIAPQGLYFDLLAGNQGDQVSVARFPISSILGVRRFSGD